MTVRHGGARGLAWAGAAAALVLVGYLVYRRYPRIIYPILPYRSLFVPVLVVAAIVVPSWLIVRLVHHRARAHPLSVGREMLLMIFVLYLAAVAAATLTPNRSSRLIAEGRGGIEIHPRLASLTCSSASLRRNSTAHAFCVHNARGNFVLFFPLGILIPLLWPQLSFGRGMLIAIALSVSIELVQYLSSAWGSYRAADVNDVILNVAGATLGLALVWVLRLRRWTEPAASRS
ncbi:MAG TPA: VanZ family protein [Gemmatimonadaceae bacterium]|nr:VanZ family protein [Gemmatimonadaceae bacterium]